MFIILNILMCLCEVSRMVKYVYLRALTVKNKLTICMLYTLHRMDRVCINILKMSLGNSFKVHGCLFSVNAFLCLH